MFTITVGVNNSTRRANFLSYSLYTKVKRCAELVVAMGWDNVPWYCGLKESSKGKFVSTLNYLSIMPWRQMGSTAIVPLFLTWAQGESEWSDSCPGSFTPGKSSPVLVGQEAGWARSRSGCCGEDKNIVLAEIGIPAGQSVSISAQLTRVLSKSLMF
jgi:hypothetical protein